MEGAVGVFNSHMLSLYTPLAFECVRLQLSDPDPCHPSFALHCACPCSPALWFPAVVGELSRGRRRRKATRIGAVHRGFLYSAMRPFIFTCKCCQCAGACRRCSLQRGQWCVSSPAFHAAAKEATKPCSRLSLASTRTALNLASGSTMRKCGDGRNGV